MKGNIQISLTIGQIGTSLHLLLSIGHPESIKCWRAQVEIYLNRSRYKVAWSKQDKLVIGQKVKFWGSGCGTVWRAVATDGLNPVIDNFIYYLTELKTVLDRQKEKEVRNHPFKKVIFCVKNRKQARGLHRKGRKYAF